MVKSSALHVLNTYPYLRFKFLFPLCSKNTLFPDISLLKIRNALNDPNCDLDQLMVKSTLYMYKLLIPVYNILITYSRWPNFGLFHFRISHFRETRLSRRDSGELMLSLITYQIGSTYIYAYNSQI